MEKHSPGPWRSVIKDKHFGKPCEWDILDDRNHVVVTVYSDNVADAPLIASAPALLALLKRCVSVIETNVTGGRDNVEAVLDSARYAIDLATGYGRK